MLLEGKCAVVYGAGGAIGAAVAKAFATEGARVALVGRHVEALESVMAEISQIGGHAEVAIVDAYDQKSVEDHLSKLVGETGKVDVSFNAVGLGYVIGRTAHRGASRRLRRFCPESDARSFSDRDRSRSAHGVRWFRSDPHDHRVAGAPAGVGPRKSRRGRVCHRGALSSAGG